MDTIITYLQEFWATYGAYSGYAGLAFLWMILSPILIGMGFSSEKGKIRIGRWYLSGWLVLFAAAEVIILIFTFLGMPFHLLAWVYELFILAMAVYGLCSFLLNRERTRKDRAREKLQQKENGEKRRHSLYLLLVVVIIIAQIVLVVGFTHYDEDDAFYIGTATTTLYTDTIYKVDPYTGLDYEAVPSRYLFSPFPILLAIFCRLCGNLHPAIMAHVIYPGVFLMLAYIVFYELGKHFFRNSVDGPGLFTLFAAAISLCSAVSVFNSVTFMMVRIWQGKALLAGVILPLTFLLCMETIMKQQPEYPWKMLLFANMSACLLSSMGILLSPIMIGAMTLVSAMFLDIRKRALKGVICLLPSVSLGIIYYYLFVA